MPHMLVPQMKDPPKLMPRFSKGMVQVNRIAPGRVVVHSRERLMVIEPRGAAASRSGQRMARRNARRADLSGKVC